MSYLYIIFYLFVVFVLLDIYIGLKHQKVLSHIIITNNYYEKILLLKKIITLKDIAETRQRVREEVGERNYEKIKDIFLHYDYDYINEAGLDKVDRINKDRIKEFLYHRDYSKATKHLIKIQKEQIKKKNKTI